MKTTAPSASRLRPVCFLASLFAGLSLLAVGQTTVPTNEAPTSAAVRGPVVTAPVGPAAVDPASTNLAAIQTERLKMLGRMRELSLKVSEARRKAQENDPALVAKAKRIEEIEAEARQLREALRMAVDANTNVVAIRAEIDAIIARVRESNESLHFPGPGLQRSRMPPGGSPLAPSSPAPPPENPRPPRSEPPAAPGP